VWLAIDTPEVDQKISATSTQYDIRLSYQIVNIDTELTDIAVPHIDLIYSDGNETLKALVPASRVSASALRDQTQDNLQPDRAPFLLPQRYLGSIVSGSLLLCSLAGLAYLYWGLPFLGKNRPFAGVYRSLRKRRHRSWDDDSYREALQDIHRAFNETAGKTVFAERLDEFFNDHIEYAPLQQSITDYFSHSRTYFFEGDKDHRNFQYALSDLVTLVEACRGIERGLV
jgi:mxaA protein